MSRVGPEVAPEVPGTVGGSEGFPYVLRAMASDLRCAGHGPTNAVLPKLSSDGLGVAKVA